MRSLALPCFALLLAACGSPIVGAECRDGFVNCDGECVDLVNDPDHCGTCEDSCGAFSCEDSECTTRPRPDGGDGDGDGDGDMDGGGGTGGRRDGGITPIGTGNPFLPDGGFMFPDPMVDDSCPIGTTRCGDECINPNTSHEHCGGCDMPCAADQLCALGTCVDACEDPLELCNSACVDYQSDPLNCGSCSFACTSGICEAGVCADTVAGHVVVIGHDYLTSSQSMRRVAYNALFQADGSPRRTLVYRGDATTQSISGVRNAINNSGLADAENGWEEIGVSASQLTSELLGADALIIAAQSNATDTRLIELGRRWGLALAQFVARGGVIVLFETQTSKNAGTYQILEPSGLFTADGRSEVTSGRLSVKVPIGVGLNVGVYSVSRTTVAFDNPSSEGLVVVTTADDRPVVIHRVVSP